MRGLKDIIAPMALLLLIVTVALLFRPFLIIDETRYVGVAWEMFNSGNYFVPTNNNLPYDHKPPLLFWLINLNWHIFGVNEFSIRFIPLIFSMGNIYLSYKIYIVLWRDDIIGKKIIGWVVAGSIVYSFYSTLFMFDIILSFWVLLALYGGLNAAMFNRFRDYALISFAVGFGILAKSPVVVAHLIPLYLLASYWSIGKVKLDFYIKGLFALIFGVVIALFWAIPAAKIGGEEFAYGIFWGQYAGRAIDAFKHKREFWWYIPWIPLLLMPWFLSNSFLNGLQKLKTNYGVGERFLVIWIGGTLLIFALISGKQLHYIAPEFIALAILTARAISLSTIRLKTKIIGLLYILFGISFILAPWFISGYIRIFLDTKAFIISGMILGIYGLYLFKKEYRDKITFVKILSLGAFIFIVTIHFSAHRYLAAQDLTRFSKTISKLQVSGKKVAHLGKYNNQFRFLGRSHTPLVIIKNKSELNLFIKNNPNGAIVIYRKHNQNYNQKAIIAKTKFRTQDAILVSNKNWEKLSIP